LHRTSSFFVTTKGLVLALGFVYSCTGPCYDILLV
jgi:hypothetical protein